MWTVTVDPLCRVSCSSTAAGCTLNPDYTSETHENNISTTHKEKSPLSGCFSLTKKRNSNCCQTENSQRSRGIPEDPGGRRRRDPTTRSTAELRSAGSRHRSTRSQICGGFFLWFEERKCSSILRPPTRAGSERRGDCRAQSTFSCFNKHLDPDHMISLQPSPSEPITIFSFSLTTC